MAVDVRRRVLAPLRVRVLPPSTLERLETDHLDVEPARERSRLQRIARVIAVPATKRVKDTVDKAGVDERTIGRDPDHGVGPMHDRSGVISIEEIRLVAACERPPSRLAQLHERLVSGPPRPGDDPLTDALRPTRSLDDPRNHGLSRQWLEGFAGEAPGSHPNLGRGHDPVRIPGHKPFTIPF